MPFQFTYASFPLLFSDSFRAEGLTPLLQFLYKSLKDFDAKMFKIAWLSLRWIPKSGTQVLAKKTRKVTRKMTPHRGKQASLEQGMHNPRCCLTLLYVDRIDWPET
jgi:hypothetical protein